MGPRGPEDTVTFLQMIDYRFGGNADEGLNHGVRDGMFDVQYVKRKEKEP